MLARSPLLANNVRDFWQSPASPASMLVFLVFVIAGAAFIIFAKLTGFTDRYVALVPVLIMLAYAGVARAAPAIRLRDDQTGDNLYYMGFLFTLTSLGVALYQFEPTIGFEAIVRNFGIALSSTIAGIALRVIFNQMRQDPIEVEHAARQELAEAARQVRQQLNDTVLTFNHFRSATLQSIQEGQEELRTRLLNDNQVTADKAIKSIEQVSQKTEGAIDTFTSTMTRALDRTVAQLDAESSKLAKSISGVETAFASVKDRLEAMQTPDRVIESKFEPAVSALTSAVTEFAKQSEVHAAALTRAAEAMSRGKSQTRWRFWRR